MLPYTLPFVLGVTTPAPAPDHLTGFGVTVATHYYSVEESSDGELV
jgi:hypothetical protein